jgi:(1->4)-alpha-D-glucan 1-alpha-D-glucosylmutase
VNLSLVDPDNRRPVDYVALRGRLDRLETGRPDGLDDEKLLVTTKALRVRRELRDAFGDGATYEPMATSTEHALGFVRSGRVACVATRAPRRLEEGGGWGDQTLSLPEGAWHDELTGRDHGGGPQVRCADVLGELPVALLVAR